MHPELSTLIAATRDAYTLLANGSDPDGVYARLAKAYAFYGLDANVAESSVDWLEGGTLTDDLTDALDKRPTADDIVRMWGGR
jgi:hypothetical protein